MDTLLTDNIIYYARTLVNGATVIGHTATIDAYTLLDLKSWIQAYELEKRKEGIWNQPKQI